MAYFLAKSLRDLDDYLEHHSNERKVIAQDTEYTTLDLTKATLSGVSVSLAAESAIYIPTGHTLGENLPIPEVFQRLHQKTELDGLLTSYFNAKGDRTMTLKSGGWAPVRFRDVANGRYHWDCERKSGNSLKELAKEILGFDMARFEELFTPEERKARHLDISGKSPPKVRDYACADADATLRLDEHWDDIFERHAQLVMPVDMKLVDIIACMEYEGGLELNRDYIDQHEAELALRMRALEAVIHRMAGRKFDVTSAQQLAPILFDELQIKHPFPPKKQKGKSGQWTTNAEALEKIDHPIAELVISYRKVSRAVGTYLKRLKYLTEKDIAPRFILNQYRATTFRLSAPGGNPKEDGKTGLNAQAIGKGAVRSLFGVDLSTKGSSRDYADAMEDGEMLVDLSEEFGPGSQEDSDSQILTLTDETHADVLRKLPYVLGTSREDENGNPFTGLACFRDHCRNCRAGCETRGIDVTRRLVEDCRVVPSMRRAFQAPEGYSIVSLDYDRQEIVIAANLSGEPVWIESLLKKEDIHAATARKAFGYSLEEWDALAEHVRSYERETGKRLNFGTLFGAVAATLARKMGIPLSKAEEIVSSFEAGLSVLMAWKMDVIATAKACGYTQTYFGRRRPLDKFFKARGGDARGLISYAERCAVNTWIQGTGADMVRIAMAKIWSRCEKEGIDRGLCRLGLQVHDELMYLVKDTELHRIIPILKQEMEFRVKSWKVQLEVGCKVGRVWGEQKKYEGAA